MPFASQSDAPDAISHAFGMPSESQSGSHVSGTPLVLQSRLGSSAISQSSGRPLKLQSRLPPEEMSHSSGTALALQSCEVPVAMSVASGRPLPLQSLPVRQMLACELGVVLVAMAWALASVFDVPSELFPPMAHSPIVNVALGTHTFGRRFA